MILGINLGPLLREICVHFRDSVNQFLGYFGIFLKVLWMVFWGNFGSSLGLLCKNYRTSLGVICVIFWVLNGSIWDYSEGYFIGTKVTLWGNLSFGGHSSVT